jgi:hypothetical protein
MHYALLIYADPHQPESAEFLGQYDQFAEEASRRNILRGGHRLHRSNTSKKVVVRNGRARVTDGPYAETKEQLGGFILIECDTIDDALAWAAKVPSARDGCIEVRQIAVGGEPVEPAP